MGRYNKKGIWKLIVEFPRVITKYKVHSATILHLHYYNFGTFFKIYSMMSIIFKILKTNIKNYFKYIHLLHV